jgi:hypothetical protein
MFGSQPQKLAHRVVVDHDTTVEVCLKSHIV